MEAIHKRKKHTDTLRNITLSQVDEVGVSYQVFSNVVVENVSVSDSPNAKQAFRFHNSDKAPAIDEDGGPYNLVLRHCNVNKVKGDGIYITAVNGLLVENCQVAVSTGNEADACQLAYENDDRNVTRQAMIRGNIFTYEPASSSGKGAIVCGMTSGYQVEYNLLEGRNFGISSIGNGAIVRSNVIRGSKLNRYSAGYMIGERYSVREHHVYDNWIDSCSVGIGISSFKDADVNIDGISGNQRSDLDIHDNVISNCETAVALQRAWSGRIHRNIFMTCGRSAVSEGRGRQIASLGQSSSQDLSENYLNDGSFLVRQMPRLKRRSDRLFSVSMGEWSETPDEFRIYWRDRGIDIKDARSPTFEATQGMELSCIVLARRNRNWMIAVAEIQWEAGSRFVPRAREAGMPWGQRYVKVS